MRLEALERAFLVRSHQPRVAGHVGGKDRGETAFDGLLHGLPSGADHSTTATAGTEEWILIRRLMVGPRMKGIADIDGTRKNPRSKPADDLLRQGDRESQPR